MNFFFGFKYKNFSSKLTIPKFQNRKEFVAKYKLYQANIYQNKWLIEELDGSVNQEYFYTLDSELVDNRKIYLLANDNQVKKSVEHELLNYNSFTNTSPEYRANLQVSIMGGGFSSYQSDYPFSMTTKKGSIVSSCSSLTNKNADQNYIIFKNIYYLPIQEKFTIYFVNIKSKKIIQRKEVYTNFTNIIKVDKELIDPNVYLFTDEFIGIPIFLSVKNDHLSFEHTHPPHSFVMGKNQFKIVSRVKDEIRKIIN